MEKADKWHLGLTAFGAMITILALVWAWPGVISGCVVALVNLYLVAVLIEAALLSSRSEHPEKGYVLIRLPRKTWTLLVAILLITIIISAFANMYVKSGEVVHQTKDVALGQSSSTGSNVGVLTSRSDAVYFSLITLTTVGFGDYVPAGNTARVLVVWQVVTGLLLLLGAFPFLLTRIADFPRL